MSDLDLTTLSLTITLAAFVCAAMMYVIWRINSDMAGVREWMLASVIHGTAFLTPFAAMLFTFIPRYWFTALNNTLTLTALMFALEGSLRFRGYTSARRLRLLWLLIPLLAVVAAINMQAIVPRYLFHDAVAVAGLTAMAVIMMWRTANKEEKIVYSLMSMFAGVLALAFLLRWLTALSMEFDSPASSIPANGVLFVAIMLYTIGWTLSAILACYYRANNSLIHLAREDALTGLPNRRSIDDELSRTLVQSQRTGREFAVIVIDLNGFKAINDQLGHTAGDELLKAVAGRLRSYVRSSDFAGRMGGDEFVIIIHEPGDMASAGRAMGRLRHSISDSMEIARQPVTLTVSAGMSHWPKDGETADELLSVADRRMYQDKPVNRQRRESSRPPSLKTLA